MTGGSCGLDCRVIVGCFFCSVGFVIVFYWSALVVLVFVVYGFRVSWGLGSFFNSDRGKLSFPNRFFIVLTHGSGGPWAASPSSLAGPWAGLAFGVCNILWWVHGGVASCSLVTCK